MKKFILILIGISILLGGTIFILYRNEKYSSDEVVDIFKEEEKEEDKDVLTEKLINEEGKEEETKVIVDIKGMVNSPGVYEIENGKRINDVIAMAGGLTEGADTSNINLAKIVKDEMTIIVYSKEEVLEKYKKEECICDCQYIENDACITETSNDNTLSLININVANKEELMNLPGLGEAKAKAIIEYREKNGNFKSIENVKDVPGIGEAIFEKIKDYITV